MKADSGKEATYELKFFKMANPTGQCVIEPLQATRLCTGSEFGEENIEDKTDKHSKTCMPGCSTDSITDLVPNNGDVRAGAVAAQLSSTLFESHAPAGPCNPIDGGLHVIYTCGDTVELNLDSDNLNQRNALTATKNGVVMNEDYDHKTEPISCTPGCVATEAELANYKSLGGDQVALQDGDSVKHGALLAMITSAFFDDINSPTPLESCPSPTTRTRNVTCVHGQLSAGKWSKSVPDDGYFTCQSGCGTQVSGQTTITTATRYQSEASTLQCKDLKLTITTNTTCNDGETEVTHVDQDDNDVNPDSFQESCLEPCIDGDEAIASGTYQTRTLTLYTASKPKGDCPEPVDRIEQRLCTNGVLGHWTFQDLNSGAIHLACTAGCTINDALYADGEDIPVQRTRYREETNVYVPPMDGTTRGSYKCEQVHDDDLYRCEEALKSLDGQTPYHYSFGRGVDPNAPATYNGTEVFETCALECGTADEAFIETRRAFLDSAPEGERCLSALVTRKKECVIDRDTNTAAFAESFGSWQFDEPASVPDGLSIEDFVSDDDQMHKTCNDGCVFDTGVQDAEPRALLRHGQTAYEYREGFLEEKPKGGACVPIQQQRKRVCYAGHVQLSSGSVWETITAGYPSSSSFSHICNRGCTLPVSEDEGVAGTTEPAAAPLRTGGDVSEVRPVPLSLAHDEDTTLYRWRALEETPAGKESCEWQLQSRVLSCSHGRLDDGGWTHVPGNPVPQGEPLYAHTRCDQGCLRGLRDGETGRVAATYYEKDKVSVDESCAPVELYYEVSCEKGANSVIKHDNGATVYWRVHDDELYTGEIHSNCTTSCENSPAGPASYTITRYRQELPTEGCESKGFTRVLYCYGGVKSDDGQIRWSGTVLQDFADEMDDDYPFNDCTPGCGLGRAHGWAQRELVTLYSEDRPSGSPCDDVAVVVTTDRECMRGDIVTTTTPKDPTLLQTHCLSGCVSHDGTNLRHGETHSTYSDSFMVVDGICLGRLGTVTEYCFDGKVSLVSDDDEAFTLAECPKKLCFADLVGNVISVSEVVRYKEERPTGRCVTRLAHSREVCRYDDQNQEYKYVKEDSTSEPELATTCHAGCGTGFTHGTKDVKQRIRYQSNTPLNRNCADEEGVTWELQEAERECLDGAMTPWSGYSGSMGFAECLNPCVSSPHVSVEGVRHPALAQASITTPTFSEVRPYGPCSAEQAMSTFTYQCYPVWGSQHEGFETPPAPSSALAGVDNEPAEVLHLTRSYLVDTTHPDNVFECHSGCGTAGDGELVYTRWVKYVDEEASDCVAASISLVRVELCSDGQLVAVPEGTVVLSNVRRKNTDTIDMTKDELEAFLLEKGYSTEDAAIKAYKHDSCNGVCTTSLGVEYSIGETHEHPVTRYMQERPIGQCEALIQVRKRVCIAGEDGKHPAFGAFDVLEWGPYQYSECEPGCGGEGESHDSEWIELRFMYKHATPSKSCEQQEQKRVMRCNKGEKEVVQGWHPISEDAEVYTHTSCLDGCLNVTGQETDLAHEETYYEYRIRYQQQKPLGECVQEQQKKAFRCRDGNVTAWSDFDGTFTAQTCFAGCPDEDLKHEECLFETRLAFVEERPKGEACRGVAQERRRCCDRGVVGDPSAWRTQHPNQELDVTAETCSDGCFEKNYPAYKCSTTDDSQEASCFETTAELKLANGDAVQTWRYIYKDEVTDTLCDYIYQHRVEQCVDGELEPVTQWQYHDEGQADKELYVFEHCEQRSCNPFTTSDGEEVYLLASLGQTYVDTRVRYNETLPNGRPCEAQAQHKTFTCIEAGMDASSSIWEKPEGDTYFGYDSCLAGCTFVDDDGQSYPTHHGGFILETQERFQNADALCDEETSECSTEALCSSQVQQRSMSCDNGELGEWSPWFVTDETVVGARLRASESDRVPAKDALKQMILYEATGCKAGCYDQEKNVSMAAGMAEWYVDTFYMYVQEIESGQCNDDGCTEILRTNMRWCLGEDNMFIRKTDPDVRPPPLPRARAPTPLPLRLRPAATAQVHENLALTCEKACEEKLKQVTKVVAEGSVAGSARAASAGVQPASAGSWVPVLPALVLVLAVAIASARYVRRARLGDQEELASLITGVQQYRDREMRELRIDQRMCDNTV